MASKQQHRSPPYPAGKRPKTEPLSTDSSSDCHRVELNRADCGLDFDIEANGLQGSALHNKGFAYCWSGARANVGIKGGKYCFGCKIISKQDVDMVDTPSEQQHLSRVGISRGDDSVGSLGETIHSFGFGGTGKFSTAGKFTEYGEKFGIGDVIVCSVDLEKKPLATVAFSKNGRWLGFAREFYASLSELDAAGTQANKVSWDSALFPHVLLKNVVVELLFSIGDGLTPTEGYDPWSSSIEDGNAVFGPTFSTPEECELLMMVGLPASGKTTWAETLVKEHPEKRYVLLGTNLAIDLMKVPGLLRKRNYGERFDLLMDRATGIFNTLLARAARTPRNYILDQTNVYKTARKRKLKSFVKYHKIAVVIFPLPDEHKIRAAKRFDEMGKEVPADAVCEMIAHFVLPTCNDMPGSTECFDEVIFPELGREEAQRNLDEMKSSIILPSNTNKNTNQELFSSSRERPAQSFSRPIVAKEEPLSDFERRGQISQFDMPFSDYSCSSQNIPPYSRPSLSSEHFLGPGDTSLARNYEGTVTHHYRDDFDRFESSNITPTSIRRSEFDRYGTYDRTPSFHSGEFDRSSSSFGRNSSLGEMRQYQSPVSKDNFRKPNFESSSQISRPYRYSPPLPSFGHRDSGAPHLSYPATADQFDQIPQINYASYAAMPPPQPFPRPRDARSRMNHPPHSWNP